jgi:phasin family protein
MAKQTNPFMNFDVTKIFADFDPAKMADEFTKMTGQFNMPVFNMDAMMANQRKNIEALTAANKAAVEGMQMVAARQAEILQESLDEATKIVTELSKSGNPQDVAGKHVDLYTESFEKALVNMRELADMITESSTVSTKLVNERFNESLSEIKAAATTVTKTTGKKADK